MKLLRLLPHASSPTHPFTFRAMSRLRCELATVLLFVSLAGSFVPTAKGVSYVFTNIADSSGTFSGFNEFSINSGGTVAFHGVLDTFDQGIFTGSGGPITTIALASQPIFSTFSGFPAINASGTVAFFSFVEGGGEGIFRGNGGATTTIALTSGPTFSSLFAGPSINAAGTVFFQAVLDDGTGDGIFSGSGGGTASIYLSTDTSFGSFGGIPSINSAGTLAFEASLDTGGSGIFKGSGGSATTIPLTSGPTFSSFGGNPGINAGGTVVFMASLDAGGSGIFTGSGGSTTTIALTSGPTFSLFRRPSISAAGVCFYADLDAGGSGIFTGPAAVADKIIATGDPLFGSTVTTLHQDNQDLNDSGQAVFRYALADGRTGLAVATPALQLTAGVSRKMHDALGPFDINLPLTGGPGVECRRSGGIHTLVFSFTNDVVSGDASVTSGTGVAGTPSFVGKTMTVSLSGVTDVQKLTVTLSDVTDNFTQVLPDTAVSVNMLIGDTTGNKKVNSSDIGQTKAQSGAAVTATNFRQDVTVTGSINASDIGLVKSRSGAGLP